MGSAGQRLGNCLMSPDYARCNRREELLNVPFQGSGPVQRRPDPVNTLSKRSRGRSQGRLSDYQIIR